MPFRVASSRFYNPAFYSRPLPAGVCATAQTGTSSQVPTTVSAPSANEHAATCSKSEVSPPLPPFCRDNLRSERNTDSQESMAQRQKDKVFAEKIWQLR